MRILSEYELIAEYPVAAHPPKIRITEFKQSENLARLKWEGNADKNATPRLEFGVRFTNDGKHWRPLVASTSTTHIVVNTDLLPGGQNCRFQVLASAGFRTATVDTKLVSLRIKPREIFIGSPRNDSEYEVGTPIYFCGTGFSPDFGNNKLDEIIWNSSAVGKIGIGQQFNTAQLPVGYHWITVNVPNGLDNMAIKGVAIRVIPRKQCGETKELTQIPRRRFGNNPCGCTK